MSSSPTAPGSAGWQSSVSGGLTKQVRALAVLAAIVLGLVLVPAFALAQCPMCGKTAEYAGASPGEANRTLAVAVVVLLTPALGIMGGMAALLWKHRRPRGDVEGIKP